MSCFRFMSIMVAMSQQGKQRALLHAGHSISGELSGNVSVSIQAPGSPTRS